MLYDTARHRCRLDYGRARHMLVCQDDDKHRYSLLGLPQPAEVLVHFLDSDMLAGSAAEHARLLKGQKAGDTTG